MYSYRVYSGNWESRLEAQDFQEAVLKGTQEQFDALKDKFCLGHVIVVENLSKSATRLFSPVSVLQDIGQYELARSFSAYLTLMT